LRSALPDHSLEVAPQKTLRRLAQLGELLLDQNTLASAIEPMRPLNSYWTSTLASKNRPITSHLNLPALFMRMYATQHDPPAPDMYWKSAQFDSSPSL
jgi:hypothetical protein